ncbi:hypothetical protein [Paracoccus sp. MKU1]|nr:hypothetical protein [Paracoccus sp. MKU1]KRW96839.1 hypothetical protein AQY21_07045 [Paracoccus sp. MKU1]
MTTNDKRGLVRILNIDAATCLAMGLLLVLAARPVGTITAIPGPVLFYAGVLLIPIGICMAVIGRAGTGSALAVWLVILGNVGWTLVSVALLAFITPNVLGIALILTQALIVGLLAWLEYRAWSSLGDRADAVA